MKKPVSIVLLIYSITIVVLSTIGLVALAENGYTHAWKSGYDVNDKSETETLDAGVGLTYHRYINQGIENPYGDGWE